MLICSAWWVCPIWRYSEWWCLLARVQHPSSHSGLEHSIYFLNCFPYPHRPAKCTVGEVLTGGLKHVVCCLYACLSPACVLVHCVLNYRLLHLFFFLLPDVCWCWSHIPVIRRWVWSIFYHTIEKRCGYLPKQFHSCSNFAHWYTLLQTLHKFSFVNSGPSP